MKSYPNVGLPGKAMNRNEWEFEYSGPSILEAAQAQVAYHKLKVEHWKNSVKTAEEDLRKEGIEIVHHQVTGGTQATAQLDPEKAKHLSLCQSKVETHKSELAGYENWVNVLADKMGSLKLTYHDVLYFWPTEQRAEDPYAFE